MSRSQQTLNRSIAWSYAVILPLVLAFSVGLRAGETGVFTFANFSAANQMSDTNVGILSTKTYQNTSNINGVALTINGVAFTATTSAPRASVGMSC